VNPEGEVVYLRLIGRLEADNRLRLRPGHLTSRPRQIDEDPDSDLVAVLVDEDGKTLLRHGVPLLQYCADGEPPGARAVRATIPFHPRTRSIRFLRDDVHIHQIDVSPTPPKVELTWEPGEGTGKQRITWRAEHPEGLPLEFFLRYSHDGGRTWQRASLRTRETHQTLDLDALPGGRRCAVAVVATDGVNTTIATSRVFAVPVKPCRALILAPEDGAELEAEEPVVLEGQGFYLEEGTPELEELRWSSNPSGFEGEGALVTVLDPAPGKYSLTLEAGRGDRVGRETVSIVVRGGRRGRPRRSTSA
jgi:hypothetical protein